MTSLTESEQKFKAEREGGQHILSPQRKREIGDELRDLVCGAYNLNNIRKFILDYPDSRRLFYWEGMLGMQLIIDMDWLSDEGSARKASFKRIQNKNSPYDLSNDIEADNPGWEGEPADFLNTAKAADVFNEVLVRNLPKTHQNEARKIGIMDIREKISKNKRQYAPDLLEACGEYLRGIFFDHHNLYSDKPTGVYVVYRDNSAITYRSRGEDGFSLELVSNGYHGIDRRGSYEKELMLFPVGMPKSIREKLKFPRTLPYYINSSDKYIHFLHYQDPAKYDPNKRAGYVHDISSFEAYLENLEEIFAVNTRNTGYASAGLNPGLKLIED